MQGALPQETARGVSPRRQMPRRTRDQTHRRKKSAAAERPESGNRGRRSPVRGRTLWFIGAFVGVVLLIIVTFIALSAADSPAWLHRQAEAAVLAGDWAAAAEHWRSFNKTRAAGSASHLAEARACLSLGRAAQAERSLNRAINADPSNPEPWRLMLQILHVEDRVIEAQELGWMAYDHVDPKARRDLLRELTLGLLAEIPDDLVRTTLRRWLDADSNDLNAEVALWQRITDQPRATDPDRPTILSTLEGLLVRHPEHVGARDALVTALANAGETERGRRDP